MEKNGVAMLDNSKFVETVVGAKQLGFDPKVIVEKVSNLAKMEADKKALEEKVQFLDKRRNDLQLGLPVKIGGLQQANLSPFSF